MVQQIGNIIIPSSNILFELIVLSNLKEKNIVSMPKVTANYILFKVLSFDWFQTF